MRAFLTPVARELERLGKDGIPVDFLLPASRTDGLEGLEKIGSYGDRALYRMLHKVFLTVRSPPYVISAHLTRFKYSEPLYRALPLMPRRGRRFWGGGGTCEAAAKGRTPSIRCVRAHP